MKVSGLISILENIAPPELAESDDSIGLQVGDPKAEVRNVAVGLDPTPVTLRRTRSAELFVAHHPLIHRPTTRVARGTQVGDAVYTAIRNNLAVYVMHTNYDAAPDGINDALANVLGLQDTEVLAAKGYGRRFKIAVFVPVEVVGAVRDAMAEAGAGIIGRYTHCSFRAPGIGSFKPMPGASPYVGRVGDLEEVNEWRLEMIVSEEHREGVVSAMLSAHPYEEVAYDVYELADSDRSRGLGRIGRIPPTKAQDLLALVQQKLRAPDARYCGPKDAVFERVAVCGGGGSGLIPDAAAGGAQVYITGDVGYHSRLLAEHKSLAIIDAGHRETELPGMRKLATRLRSLLSKDGIRVTFVG